MVMGTEIDDGLGLPPLHSGDNQKFWKFFPELKKENIGI